MKLVMILFAVLILGTTFSGVLAILSGAELFSSNMAPWLSIGALISLCISIPILSVMIEEEIES